MSERPKEIRDDIPADWDHVIYFCPECDEEERVNEDYTRCPRYPAEHDETGYMGTGTAYPESVRELARRIAGWRADL